MSRIICVLSPLSLSRSSASANNCVSLALVISIISYLHHAKSRNSTNNCIPGRYTNHVDVTRNSVASDGSVLAMHRSVLEISCDFAPQNSSPNGGPASKPLARYTRHSSGNMEHSDIWQVFWTHDSRVNLHISTDYSKGKASGGLVTFLHGCSERSSSARGALQAFFCHRLGSSRRRVPQLGEDNFLSEGRRRPWPR
jgi:hypothetical protein